MADFPMARARKSKRTSRNRPGEASTRMAPLPLSWRQSFLRSGSAAIRNVCEARETRIYSFSSPKQSRPHIVLRPVEVVDSHLPEIQFSDIRHVPRQFQAAIMFDLAYRVRAGRYQAVVQRYPRCPHRFTDEAALRLTYWPATNLQRAVDLLERYERRIAESLTEDDRAFLRQFLDARERQRLRDRIGVHSESYFDNG